MELERVSCIRQISRWLMKWQEYFFVFLWGYWAYRGAATVSLFHRGRVANLSNLYASGVYRGIATCSEAPRISSFLQIITNFKSYYTLFTGVPQLCGSGQLWISFLVLAQFCVWRDSDAVIWQYKMHTLDHKITKSPLPKSSRSRTTWCSAKPQVLQEAPREWWPTGLNTFTHKNWEMAFRTLLLTTGMLLEGRVHLAILTVGQGGKAHNCQGHKDWDGHIPFVVRAISTRYIFAVRKPHRDSTTDFYSILHRSLFGIWCTDDQQGCTLARCYSYAGLQRNLGYQCRIIPVAIWCRPITFPYLSDSKTTGLPNSDKHLFNFMEPKSMFWFTAEIQRDGQI